MDQSQSKWPWKCATHGPKRRRQLGKVGLVQVRPYPFVAAEREHFSITIQALDGERLPLQHAALPALRWLARRVYDLQACWDYVEMDRQGQ